MSSLSNAVSNAMLNAYKLKSSVGNWEDAVESLQNSKYTHNAIITAYDSYNQTPWGATFTSLLGRNLLASSLCNNILDIGSGRSATFNNLISKQNVTNEIRYVSIDNKISTDETKAFLIDIQCLHTHIPEDIFKLPLNWFNNHKRFDVVIIDVEPHGRELEVYDVIADSLADNHLIILKCVGMIDLMGTAFADRFISKMLSRQRLVDYFGVANLNLTRDVFVIARSEGHHVKFDGSIRNRILADDGKHSDYFYEENWHKSMICYPSSKVVDELMHGLVDT
jgi:hypothetical protein